MDLKFLIIFCILGRTWTSSIIKYWTVSQGGCQIENHMPTQVTTEKSISCAEFVSFQTITYSARCIKESIRSHGHVTSRSLTQTTTGITETIDVTPYKSHATGQLSTQMTISTTETSKVRGTSYAIAWLATQAASGTTETSVETRTSYATAWLATQETSGTTETSVETHTSYATAWLATQETSGTTETNDVTRTSLSTLAIIGNTSNSDVTHHSVNVAVVAIAVGLGIGFSVAVVIIICCIIRKARMQPNSQRKPAMISNSNTIEESHLTIESISIVTEVLSNSHMSRDRNQLQASTNVQAESQSDLVIHMSSHIPQSDENDSTYTGIDIDISNDNQYVDTTDSKCARDDDYISPVHLTSNMERYKYIPIGMQLNDQQEYLTPVGLKPKQERHETVPKGVQQEYLTPVCLKTSMERNESVPLEVQLSKQQEYLTPVCSKPRKERHENVPIGVQQEYLTPVCLRPNIERHETVPQGVQRNDQQEYLTPVCLETSMERHETVPPGVQLNDQEEYLTPVCLKPSMERHETVPLNEQEEGAAAAAKIDVEYTKLYTGDDNEHGYDILGNSESNKTNKIRTSANRSQKENWTLIHPNRKDETE